MPPPVLLPLRSCEAAGRAPPGAAGGRPRGHREGPRSASPREALPGPGGGGQAGGETPLPAAGTCGAPQDRARRRGGEVAAVPAARQVGGDPVAGKVGGACARYWGGVWGRVPGTGRLPPLG